jgi:hypothetical protein
MQHRRRATTRPVDRAVTGTDGSACIARERPGRSATVVREPGEPTARSYERERREGTRAVHGILYGVVAAAGLWALIGAGVLAIVR